MAAPFIQLTANFALGEYACRCGCTYHTMPHIRAAIERHAKTIMQPVRDAVGVPLTITSGVRCPEWNAHVGGAEDSFHMKGMAADFIPRGKGLVEVHRATVAIPAVGGCKRYGTFIHADWRARVNGRVVTWP